MMGSLVQKHHAAYTEDIPFWKSWTDRRDPILELGCGFGRVTIPLSLEGHQLVGLDTDWECVRHLMAKLKESDQDYQGQVLILQADMLHFYTNPVFSAVLLPCNTYSVFPTHDRQRLLFNVTRMLKKKGLFIISVPNPQRITEIHENLREKDINPEPDLETVITHPETRHPVQVSSQFIATPDGVRWDWFYDQLFPDGRVDRIVRSTEHKLCSLDIYRREFQMVDLKVIACLGDFNGAFYEDEAPYLILVGQRH